MPGRRRSPQALAFAFLSSTLAAAATQTHFTAADCIESASSAEINYLLRTGGAGTSIVLCPYAQVSIDAHDQPITFTAARQAIYTRGFPEDHSRATLVIENPQGHFSGDLTTAIAADCDACEGVVIRNLHVDGGREQLGGLEGTDALLVVGGEAGAQEVRSVDAWGARGFAVIHAAAGAQGACRDVVIADNVVHTSGDAPLDAFLQSELARLRDGPPAYMGIDRPGTWTDGISLACAHSSVSENTIRDVSGVGIAVRGSPGSQVFQNTIVARDRDMLSGISLVANPVFRGRAGDLGGVTVRENRIHAASAMVRVGISTGAGSWATDELIGDHEIPFASEITKNRLSSYTGYFGYAIALSDARNIVVQDNAISASIWGFETSACYERPAFVAPTPLLRDPRSVIGSLQPSFVDKHFGFLLCVGPGSPSSSFEMSRHQINDAQARSYHAAASHVGMKAGGRNGRGRGRPAEIPLKELHPHAEPQPVRGGKTVPKRWQQEQREGKEGDEVAPAYDDVLHEEVLRMRHYPTREEMEHPQLRAVKPVAATQESDAPKGGFRRSRLKGPRGGVEPAAGAAMRQVVVRARDKRHGLY
ncbi:hypothetical protein Rhopal_002528-T1 [Rhodotorula paludigena]|uniref:Right handed beta helix domain-containing protein n=1 Tax=Rhodotorula paludigena TaxID=86838 RepID=A0AAV5GAU0_9BASI|nr:hypothetical protein Rhopal_002528-T1 [Rhodotorula paludigena]